MVKLLKNSLKTIFFSAFFAVLMLGTSVFDHYGSSTIQSTAEEYSTEPVIKNSIRSTPELPSGATHWSDTLDLELLEDDTYRVTGLKEDYQNITDLVIPDTASDGKRITGLKAIIGWNLITLTVGEKYYQYIL